MDNCDTCGAEMNVPEPEAGSMHYCSDECFLAALEKATEDETYDGGW